MIRMFDTSYTVWNKLSYQRSVTPCLKNITIMYSCFFIHGTTTEKRFLHRTCRLRLKHKLQSMTWITNLSVNLKFIITQQGVVLQGTYIYIFIFIFICIYHVLYYIIIVLLRLISYIKCNGKSYLHGKQYTQYSGVHGVLCRFTYVRLHVQRRCK